MDLFSIDLSAGEINLLRHSLDLVTITGKDAKLVAGLQYKLEHELSQIQQMLNQQEIEKAAALERAVKAEARKAAKAAQQD